MPPKRKRAETVSATGSGNSMTRPTRKSSRTTRGKDSVTEAGASDAVEPSPKKAKAKGSTTDRGKNATPRALGIDDEPLNSTTSHRQSDDELNKPKRAPVEHGAQALFKNFADDDNPDVIGPGGVERLCMEAGIPLEGAQPLILAWQFKTKEMAKVSRSEWLEGTEALKISSLPVLAMVLQELDDLVVYDKEPVTPAPSRSSTKKGSVVETYNRTRYSQYASKRSAAFTELYQFCFTLSKPPQSRNLDIETAVALWSVLLTPRYPIVTELIEFLNENGSYKGANKDIWNMVLEFCQTVDGKLCNYEADGAWPTMLDDFAVWKRGRMASSTDDTPQ